MLATTVLMVLMTSCSETTYYQFCKVTPSNQMKTENNYIVFQNDDCTISYDFFNEGGNAGFQFYNNTDSIIYLDKAKTFYTANGIAYDYFKNRHYTASSTGSKTVSNSKAVHASASVSDDLNNMASASLAESNTKGSSVAFSRSYSTDEAPILAIPPHTSRFVQEYTVLNDIFRYCELNHKDPNGLNFDIDNTPLSFGNIITYTIGINTPHRTVENNFYISNITNHASSDVTEKVKVNNCGKTTTEQITVFKESRPDIIYQEFKHSENKNSGVVTSIILVLGLILVVAAVVGY